jgi:hypothetical protein
MRKLLKNILTILSLSLFLSSEWESLAEQKEGEVIATLNGEAITLSEIEQNAAFQVYRLKASIYSLLQRETEELVTQKLLAAEAARREMTIDDLLKKEVDEKLKPPGEKEVDEYLARHPEDLAKDADRKDKIKMYLHQRALLQRKLDFLASLREKADFKFLLKPPERPRIKVILEGQPWRGSFDGPVTLVHFADLTSKRSLENVQKIEKIFSDFPGKIRWVHRNYFSIHDEKGLLAAEVGEAAHEQGMFWSFHDRMFAEKGGMRTERIKELAKEIGLDKRRFEEEKKKGKYLLKIREDLGYAARIGIEGASALFVNGLYFGGGFPYEDLKSLVQKELEHKKGENP